MNETDKNFYGYVLSFVVAIVFFIAYNETYGIMLMIYFAGYYIGRKIDELKGK
jgi:hypothetical protein